MQSSTLRLWLLKKVLSLPVPVLRSLAGGGVVYVNGRTLDAQIQFLWRTWFNRTPGRIPLSLRDQSLEAARQEWQDTAAFLGAPSGLKVKYEPIGDGATATVGGSAPVSGLLIRPARIAPDAPLLVFFHQGGGVLGGAVLSKAFCAVFAHEARCPVFIPEYRLAPTNRFPAALDDARVALDWAQANAGRLGAASGQVAVGGVLTGANLAARLCLDLKRDFKPLPVAQLLVTPLLDFGDAGIKANASLGLWPITANDIDLMTGHYAGAGTDLTDPRISPAREGLIIGQPRTFVVSAGLDPLADQAEAFVHRLMAARTRTVYRRYDTLPLGFDLFAGVVHGARAAVNDMAQTWVELLRSGQAEPEPDLVQDVA